MVGVHVASLCLSGGFRVLVGAALADGAAVSVEIDVGEDETVGVVEVLRAGLGMALVGPCVGDGVPLMSSPPNVADSLGVTVSILLVGAGVSSVAAMLGLMSSPPKVAVMLGVTVSMLLVGAGVSSVAAMLGVMSSPPNVASMLGVTVAIVPVGAGVSSPPNVADKLGEITGSELPVGKSVTAVVGIADHAFVGVLPLSHGVGGAVRAPIPSSA